MNNSIIGKKGEFYAEQMLIKKGYAIKERNWRFKKAEIDLIVEKENLLVFVEVKALTYDYYGAPEQAVDAKKEALIIDAAQRYMEKIDYSWEIRFDIISIILSKSLEVNKIEHFEDAFFY